MHREYQVLNRSQTEHCWASGCVIINGRGWNSDDKKKVAIVCLWVYTSRTCCVAECVFYSVFCARGVCWWMFKAFGGDWVQRSMYMCVHVCMWLRGCSRWLNGSKATHTVTLIRGIGRGSGGENVRGEQKREQINR